MVQKINLYFKIKRNKSSKIFRRRRKRNREPRALPVELYSLCSSNGFSLRECPLEGRLLVVLLNPQIIIKNSLNEEKKQSLVKKAVSYLQNASDCQLAIFWDGEEKFFHL